MLPGECEEVLEAYRKAAELYIQTRDIRDARPTLMEDMKKAGYTPPDGNAGEWEDISDPYRIRCILETLSALFVGKENYRAAMGNIYMGFKLQFCEQPAREKYWRDKWKAAAEKVNWVGVAKNGSLLAAWFSPIWKEISDFDLPYPPFTMDKKGLNGPDASPVLWNDLVKADAITEGTARQHMATCQFR